MSPSRRARCLKLSVRVLRCVYDCQRWFTYQGARPAHLMSWSSSPRLEGIEAMSDWRVEIRCIEWIRYRVMAFC